MQSATETEDDGFLVAEGPAKFKDGKVRIRGTTRTMDHVNLPPNEVIAELRTPTPNDRKEKRLLRKARAKALVNNLQALGSGHLVEDSELSSPSYSVNLEDRTDVQNRRQGSRRPFLEGPLWGEELGGSFSEVHRSSQNNCLVLLCFILVYFLFAFFVIMTFYMFNLVVAPSTL